MTKDNSKPQAESQARKDFGFGTTVDTKLRMLNRDGTFNVIRKGLPFHETFNIYHYLITIRWRKFILIVFLWYALINLVFASLYLMVGIEHLVGISSTGLVDDFTEAYFFSTQTFTTVGYGRISPMGLPANIIASTEALVGILSIAIITGLLYGRFSKPKAKLLYSQNAIIAPYLDIKALEFRVANKLRSQMLELKCQVAVSMLLEENGQKIRIFRGLHLERDSVSFFPTSWTIVHPISEKSPFYGMDETAFRAIDPEILILFEAWDDRYYQTIHSSFSYDVDEIIWGARFVKTVGSTDDGYSTIDLGRLHEYQRVMFEETAHEPPHHHV